MNAVTVSPKYQIVIPKEIRKQMGIQPGQKLVFFLSQGMLTLTPMLDIREAKGLFKGLKGGFEREPDDPERV